MHVDMPLAFRLRTGMIHLKSLKSQVHVHSHLCLPLRALSLLHSSGTMADTDVFHLKVFQELLAPHGIDCTEEFYDQYIFGRANGPIAEDLFPNQSPEESHKFFEHKEEVFRARAADHLEPLEGLVNLLTELRASGVRIAAVTNATRANCEMMLRVLGVTDFFEVIIIGPECTEAKPSPIPYLEGMKQLGITDPKRCVVFEDSVTGTTAGVGAGATVVGVRTTQTEKTLHEAGAEYTVRDYRDLNIAKMVADFKDFVIPHKDGPAPHKKPTQAASTIAEVVSA